MKYLIILLYLYLGSMSLWAEERVQIFTQSADRLFINVVLDSLRAYLQEERIAYEIIDIQQGVPMEITSTPALAYLRGDQRTIYSGRYTEFSTIRNFIRTSRYRTLESQRYCSDSGWIWPVGRLKIKLQKKITPLKMEPGIQLNEHLVQLILDTIKQSTQELIFQESFCLQATDRTYYLDVHPYISKSGLFLSYEIYSQFDCIDPIHSALKSPISGSLMTMDSMLQALYTQVEKAIRQDITYSKIGDQITPIDSTIGYTPWPILSIEEEEVILSEMITGKPDGLWELLLQDPVQESALTFHFPAPLDRYRGEISGIEGRLVMEDGMLTEGQFIATMNTLTMGMQSLDSKVIEKYLKCQKYPLSHFQFNLEKPVALQWGQSTNFEIPGRFKLLRKSHEVIVNGKLTPIVSQGIPFVEVLGSFVIPLDLFNIKAPEGPDDIKNQVIVNIHFFLNQKNI